MFRTKEFTTHGYNSTMRRFTTINSNGTLLNKKDKFNLKLTFIKAVCLIYSKKLQGIK